MAGTRKRAGAARVGLVAAIAAVAAVFALPAAANPPDPTRPDIELTVSASIDRPMSWEIEKTADVDEVTLEKGQTATVNYTVTVTPTEGTTRWSALGEIIVYNKELEAVTVNSVTNVISGVGPATLVCPGSTFPRLLGSGAQLRCRFTAELPDNSNRTSTATASIDSTEFTVSAPVDFSGAIDNRIDHCVEVHDSMVGLLDEQICVNKADKTVEYSREIGPYADCGKRTVSNTAWAITNHTATRVEDTYDVKVDVPCPKPPDECKDRDKDKDKYGKYGGHDRDECDDDDRCDKDGKYDKDRHDWWDKDKCDRDDDRCDRDGKHDWWDKYDKDDKCDRDDDRCDRDGKDRGYDKYDKYDKDDKCDRDDDRCDRDGKDRGYDKYDKDDKCDRDDDRCDRGDKDRDHDKYDKDKGKYDDDRCDKDDRDHDDWDWDWFWRWLGDKHDKDDKDGWGRH